MRPIFAREPISSGYAWSAKALTLHRFILRFAFGATQIYAWIFVFEYFRFVGQAFDESFVRTILLYTLSQTITCLFTPYAARFLRHGSRRLLIVGTSLAAVALVVLNATFSGAWFVVAVSGSIVTFAVLMGLYRALYWIPYEVEFEAEGRRAVSLFTHVAVASGPLLGGLIIAGYVQGPSLLLYGGAALLALSTIPLLFARDIHEKYSWGYRETFRKLFDSEYLPIVRESFFDGISGVTLVFFWPLAVYFIVGNSYAVLGLILTASFIITFVMRSTIRRLLIRMRPSDSPLVIATFAASPWLLKLLVATPAGVIFVDSYFYTTRRHTMSVDPFAFEQAADGSKYVDEFTALKEVALALGRITACLLVALVASFASVLSALVFVVLAAALSSVVVALWAQAK